MKRIFPLIALPIAFLLEPVSSLGQVRTCAYVLRRAGEADPPAATVLVLDLETRAVTAAIPVGGPDAQPEHVAVAPDGTRAYVTYASDGEGSLAIIDTSINAVVDTVRGDVGCGVAVAPNSEIVYAGGASGDLSIIDADEAEIVGAARSASGCDIAVNENGRAVFTVGGNELRRVEARTRVVDLRLPIDTVNPGATTLGLALPPGDLLYIGDDRGIVYIVEIPRSAVAVEVASACERDLGVLTDIGVTPEGFLIYATHRYDAGDGCVAVISALSQRSTLAIPVASGATAVAVEPSGQHAYVGTGGGEEIALYVIDTAINELIDTVPLPDCGEGVEECFVQDIAFGFVHGDCAGAPPTPTETRMPTATPTPGPCFGDCDSDVRVAIDELVSGVRIALGSRPLDTCMPADSNADGVVHIDDLVRAVNAAIVGCVESEAP